MDSKICPICKKSKRIDEFHKYFSKKRGKTRIGNYCIPCANTDANRRAKEYYQKHKAKVLHYQNVERRDWKREDGKKHRDLLTDRYVLTKLKQTLNGESNYNMRLVPELIEAKRTQILTSRIIKKLKENGKK